MKNQDKTLHVRLIMNLNKAVKDFGTLQEPKQVERARRKILATWAALWKLKI